MRVRKTIEVSQNVDVDVDVDLDTVFDEMDISTFDYYAKKKGYAPINGIMVDNQKDVITKMICDKQGLPYVTDDQVILIELAKIFN